MADNPPADSNGAGAGAGVELELARLTPERRVELEAEVAKRVGVAIDSVLDAFEACEVLEYPAMPIILERLRSRGVELPPWVEMML